MVNSLAAVRRQLGRYLPMQVHLPLVAVALCRRGQCRTMRHRPTVTLGMIGQHQFVPALLLMLASTAV